MSDGPAPAPPPPERSVVRNRATATAEGLVIGLALAIMLWFWPSRRAEPDVAGLSTRMQQLYADPARPGQPVPRPTLARTVEEQPPDDVLGQMAADELRRRGAPMASLSRTRITRALRHRGEGAGETPLYLQALSVRCERGHPLFTAEGPPACGQDGGRPLGPGRYSTLLFTAPEGDGAIRVIEAALEVPLLAGDVGGRMPAELYDVRDLAGDPRPEVVLLDRPRGGGGALRVLTPTVDGQWLRLIEGWRPRTEAP